MKEIHSFGLYIRELREKFEITQAYVAKSVRISEKSYRRIETDKAVPRIETLEEMSVLFKEDLVLAFIKRNSQGMEMFEKVKFDIEKKIKQSNYEDLKKDIPRLKNLINYINSSYYILLYRQYILLIEGITVYREGNNYQKSTELFTEGILISNENFSINHYKEFSYSLIELRLLMNIAFSFNRLGDQEKYIEIFSFIMGEVDNNDPIYSTIAYNLGTAYKRSEKYVDAIGIMKKGIDYCKYSLDYSMLPILYYGMGVSEYHLNRESYQNSFKKALSLTSLLGMEHLNASMKEKCREHFQFDLADE